MAYKKVVEMLGENLASLLELAKKLLVDWRIPAKDLLHTFHNQPKDKILGLVAGTHRIVSIATLGGKTIRTLTDAFVAKAKEKGFPLYYNNEYGVDADIFGWLPNARVVDGNLDGKITMLSETTTEGTMLKTAVKFPLSQAIEKMTEKLIEGYFDEKNKVFIIFLTDEKDGVPLELVGLRSSDGELYLGVNKVFSGNRWNVDGEQVGFFSRNNP